MTTTVIRGGRLSDQTGDRRGDIVVDDVNGTIVDVDVDPDGGGALIGDSTIDATGCTVCPGFVDLNAHLGQPGREEAETIDTATRAAALGGYTAVVAMPDTDPCVDSAAVVAEVLALAKSAACEVIPAATITMGGEGANLSPASELSELGVRIYTDASRPLQDAMVMRRALEYVGGVAAASGLALIVANMGRLDALAEGGVMNEGDRSALMGVPGESAVAEELMVSRDIALARLTGSRVHIQQVSTAAAVALIGAAKDDAVPVTAEVSPHHLLLDESACTGFDPNTRVEPPLRTTADVMALRRGLLEGTIDVIATGHRPWPFHAKERPFDAAPPGTIGLETAMAAALTATGAPLAKLLPALSWRPAGIASVARRHGGPIEIGRQANLAVVDPEASWTVDPAAGASRSSNTIFAGQVLKGRVRHTISAGRPVVIDGAINEAAFHSSTTMEDV